MHTKIPKFTLAHLGALKYYERVITGTNLRNDTLIYMPLYSCKFSRNNMKCLCNFLKTRTSILNIKQWVMKIRHILCPAICTFPVVG